MPLPPINQRRFARNRQCAKAFRDSIGGSFLHELAHCCAANLEGSIDGHLVVFSEEPFLGSFVVDELCYEVLGGNKQRNSFVAVAAMLAERHFLHGIFPDRVRKDVQHWFEIQGKEPDLNEGRDWELFAAKMAQRSENLLPALWGEIEQRYELCSNRVEGAELYEQHYVFSTGELGYVPRLPARDLALPANKRHAVQRFLRPHTQENVAQAQILALPTSGIVRRILSSIFK